MESTKSGLNLLNRTILNLTGIKKVKSTEPGKIIAILDNCAIVIVGSNLSVQNLNISSGVLDITGVVNSINYTGAKDRKFSFKNLWK